jgi:hypothetical protein
MSHIQKTLDSLQPYVIGIRYVEGTPVVDTIFKEGWSLQEEPNIKKAKGDDGLNYYMIFSDVDGVGLDELLSYVERTIKLNQEREKKHDLLREKVNELKEVFKKNSLTKLNTLKFTFGEEDLVPKLDDFDLDIENTPSSIPSVEQKYEEETIIENSNTANPVFLDENGNPIEMTDEEIEMMEEEVRAERNRKLLGKKSNPISNMAKKVELPPKRKIEMAIADSDYDGECDCGPEEACGKCIDKKGL